MKKLTAVTFTYRGKRETWFLMLSLNDQGKPYVPDLDTLLRNMFGDMVIPNGVTYSVG